MGLGSFHNELSDLRGDFLPSWAAAFSSMKWWSWRADLPSIAAEHSDSNRNAKGKREKGVLVGSEKHLILSGILDLSIKAMEEVNECNTSCLTIT